MKFSVIVPVYNAENYLHKLVESVLQQTYKDYELILVDDGSTDGSYALMKQYAKRYNQIKAYTKENTGPGMTRKFGFEKATGDLLFFVDSDDSNAESPYYCCGPSEFVYLIKNAVYVCTDSFHASVFSILYNRPFVVFNRNGKHNTMGSRIQTLLSTFHLEDARFTGIIDESCICRDYKEVNQIVENERQKALRFIRKALR